eukprot:3329641-Amphidinium_carterae.1
MSQSLANLETSPEQHVHFHCLENFESWGAVVRECGFRADNDALCGCCLGGQLGSKFCVRPWYLHPWQSDGVQPCAQGHT